MNYNELKEYVKSARVTASDEVALHGIALYPYWKEGQEVAVYERYQHNSILYRVRHIPRRPDGSRILLRHYGPW